MIKIFSIRTKLGSVFFGGVFLLALGLVAIQQYHSYLQFSRYMEMSSATAVRAAIFLTDRWLTEKSNTAQVLATNIERRLAQQGGDPAAVFLEPGFDSAYAALEDGRFFGHGKPGWAKGEEWYDRTKRERGPVFIRPVPGKDASSAKMIFTAPVFDANRWMVKGVVGVDASLEGLKETMGMVFISEVERIDVVPLDLDRTGLWVKTQGLSDVASAALAARAATKLPEGETVWNVGAARYLIIHAPLGHGKLVVVYPVPLTQIVKPLVTQALMFFAVTAIGLWIIVQLTWSIVRGIVARIEELNASAKRVSTGDFETRIVRPSRDELGELAESFNRMVASLKDYMKKLEVSVREKNRSRANCRSRRNSSATRFPARCPFLRGWRSRPKAFPPSMSAATTTIFCIRAAARSGSPSPTPQERVFRARSTCPARARCSAWSPKRPRRRHSS